MAGFSIITITGPVVKELNVYERASGKTTVAKKVYVDGYTTWIIGSDDKLYRIGRYKGRRNLHERDSNAETVLEVARALGLISQAQIGELKGKWKARVALKAREEAADQVVEGMKELDIKPTPQQKKLLDQALL